MQHHDFLNYPPLGQQQLHLRPLRWCFPSTPDLWVFSPAVHHQDGGGGVNQGKTSPVRDPVPKPVPAGAGGDAEAGAEGDGTAAAELPEDRGSAPSSGLSATGVNQNSPHILCLLGACQVTQCGSRWAQTQSHPPLAPLPDHDVRGGAGASPWADAGGDAGDGGGEEPCH